MANSDINSGANIMASLNLDGGQQDRLRQAARLLNMNEQDAAVIIGRAMRKINRGNQSNTPITRIPINSLKGPAKFFLLITLFENLYSKLFMLLNLL